MIEVPIFRDGRIHEYPYDDFPSLSSVASPHLMIWKVGQTLSNNLSMDYYKSSKYTNIEGTLFQIIRLYQIWSHRAVSAAYIALLNNPTPAPAEESQGEMSASEGSDYRPTRGPGGGRGGGSGSGPSGGSRGGGSRGGAGRGDGSHSTHQRKRKRDDKECQNEDEDVEIVEFDGRYLGRVAHARVKRWITETSDSLYS